MHLLLALLPRKAVELRKGMRCSSAADRRVAAQPCSSMLGRYKKLGADKKTAPCLERFLKA